MMEQLELVKALLAGQKAKHDPANSVFGAPSVAPVPGSTPQLGGPTLGDMQKAWIDPVINFPESRQAQNLLGFRDAIQGGLAPRPTPPGASGVMGTATPGQGFQQAGGLLDMLRGPAKLAGDAISGIWNSPFIQGADPIQGPWPEYRSPEEGGRPDSLNQNLWEAEQRLKGLLEIPGKISEGMDYLTGGPSDPYQGPPPVKGAPSFSVEWNPAAAQDTAQGLAPKAPSAPTGGVAKKEESPTPLVAPTGPAFDETPTIWDKLNASGWQEALGDMARGVAGPIPVGGGGVGHVFAGAGAGAAVGREKREEEKLAAERYADALGMKLTDQEIDAFNAESRRIAAEAQTEAARAQGIRARHAADQPGKDPRKQQAEVYSSGAGATAQQRVIDQAKTNVANNYLDPHFKKILSDMAKASLAARLGENWETTFEYSGKQQETLDDELAAQVGQILSSSPELLMELYPELGPLAVELWGALAELGGAAVYRNR